LDQGLAIVDQAAGDPERVVELTTPDEGIGCEHGGAPLPHVLRLREPVQDGARFVDEPGADDMIGREIDQIPIVDAVMAAKVELIELAAPRLVGRLQGVLLGHDRQGTDAQLVNVAVEQRLDAGRRQRDELLGQREDRAHAHADESVAVAVFAFARLEVALDLAQFIVGLKGEQTVGEGAGGEGLPRLGLTCRHRLYRGRR
jgi:hypothetical protein